MISICLNVHKNCLKKVCYKILTKLLLFSSWKKTLQKLLFFKINVLFKLYLFLFQALLITYTNEIANLKSITDYLCPFSFCVFFKIIDCWSILSVKVDFYEFQQLNFRDVGRTRRVYELYF